MKKFDILVDFIGEINVTIEAETKEEAKQKFLELVKAEKDSTNEYNIILPNITNTEIDEIEGPECMGSFLDRPMHEDDDISEYRGSIEVIEFI
jgi:hypothetical protein